MVPLRNAGKNTPASSTGPDTDLVGRADELALIRTVLDLDGKALLLSGEAGIGDTILIQALHTLYFICMIGGGRAELWKPFHEAVSRLGPAVLDELRLRCAISADPARATASALAWLDHALAGLRDETDLTTLLQISDCALFVDRLTECREALRRIAREPVSVGIVEANAMHLLCIDDFRTGQWDAAERLASEGAELVESDGRRGRRRRRVVRQGAQPAWCRSLAVRPSTSTTRLWRTSPAYPVHFVLARPAFRRVGGVSEIGRQALGQSGGQ